MFFKTATRCHPGGNSTHSSLSKYVNVINSTHLRRPSKPFKVKKRFLEFSLLYAVPLQPDCLRWRLKGIETNSTMHRHGRGSTGGATEKCRITLFGIYWLPHASPMDASLSTAKLRYILSIFESIGKNIILHHQALCPSTSHSNTVITPLFFNLPLKVIE